MSLTCPRCGTDVPNETLYCPYCSLPKPKRGFADAAEGAPEETSSAEHPTDFKDFSAVAFKGAKKESRKRAKRSASRPANPKRKLRLSVLSVAALVALSSVGVYIYVVPMVYSEQAEPKTVSSALDKLRKTPSNEPNLTIDARMLRELETSRRVGNLAAYQGWTVRPIKGTKARVVFAFSYVEVGDVHQSAEWVANLTNGTFTPQTELAAAVCNR